MSRTVDGRAQERRAEAIARYDALAAAGPGFVPDQRPWRDGRPRALSHVYEQNGPYDWQHAKQVKQSRAGETRTKALKARRRFAAQADRWLQRYRRLLETKRDAARVQPKPNLVQRAFAGVRNLFRRVAARGR